ncbi:crotonase/enoyl-CoA hydratase family protein [Bordetella genomosp. 10]|nr:crotonase/enoyl-CoA hydratase family protein [Bordetella genomosp. 10]
MPPHSRLEETPPSRAPTRYALDFDDRFGVLALTWQQDCPPYFSPDLLSDMARELSAIQSERFGPSGALRYFVLRSGHPNIFSLGGDLAFFLRTILARDRQALLAYATQCAHLMHALHSGFQGGVTTIALVQGACTGGGFEAALACNYIVAERHARFSFPEIQLGIFPGMGALPLLARRLGQRDYEEVCHSGRSFSAEALADKGLIDVIADTGQGEQAANAWIRKRHPAFASHREMAAVRQARAPMSRADFEASLPRWVDVVLSLDQRRLAMLSLAIQKQQAESRSRCIAPAPPCPPSNHPQPG